MNNTLIKRFFFFLLFIVGIFSLSVYRVDAASLNILRPGDNEKVSGNTDIGWSIFDTGMATIPYEIRVKNASCSDNGSVIVSNNFSQVAQNGTYSLPWNSATVTDGVHCLQVCVKLSNGFIQCTHRIFNVVNHSNNNPIISSFPSRLSYLSNEIFQYQVIAYDVDGDMINFRLLSAPEFVFVDQNTGFMSYTNNPRIGVFHILLVVLDSQGGSSYQEFDLSIIDNKPSPTPVPKVTVVPTKPVPTKVVVKPTVTKSSQATKSPTNQPTNSAQPTSTEVAEPTEPSVKILKPNAQNILSGQENQIEWEYVGLKVEEFKDIIIEYSEFGSSNYTEIYKNTNSNVRVYKWDVGNLDNGAYSLRIKVRGINDQVLIEGTSEKFLVGNNTDGEKVLNIISLTPENKSQITDLKPILSSVFVPSEGATIDIESVEIKLDGKNITKECSIEEGGFECEMANELKIGEHKVEIQLSDTNGQSINQTWLFEVVDEGGAGGEDDEEPKDDPKSGFDLNALLERLNIDALKNYFPWCGAILLILGALFGINSLRKKSTSSYGDSTYNKKETTSYSDIPDKQDDSFNEPFDYSIGSHEVVTDTPVTQAVSDDSVAQNEEIPDWLKENTEEGAQPVGASGDPLQAAESESGGESAKVHDNFGLTPVDQGENA